MTTKPDPFPKGGKVDRALMWIETTLYALRDRWIAYMTSFAFSEELQGWPVVRHRGPGVWSIRAVHTGPRRVQDRGGWKPPVVTGVAFGVLYYFAYGRAASGGALRGESLLQQSVFCGVIFALISVPFWKLAQKTRLMIRLEQGVISWRGPDKRKHSIAPNEPRQMQVILPYRWADDERRKHDNWRTTHPRQSSPKPLFQTSSELMLHTGPEGSHWRVVAEFRNDGHGEQANRLKTAIELVTKEAWQEEATRERQAKASGPL
jgi:hypothetical protein